MATELIVWERDGRVETVEVPDEGITIGRRPSPYGASYCTQNASVSRHHCRLARLGEGWFIEDLGSANGTKVNGESADAPTPVRTGDVIQIGGLRAQLVVAARGSQMGGLPTAPERDPGDSDNSLDANLTIAEDSDDEEAPTSRAGDKVRDSYDTVAARYASELADDMVARPFERGMMLAFAELVHGFGIVGDVGDVGCGPGHIAKHLGDLGLRVVGYDVSPRMIAEAKQKHPYGEFYVGNMFALPVDDDAWLGAVSLYATLHCNASERMLVLRELERVIQPGGYLLHAFYISAPDQPEGSAYRLTSWFGEPVDLDTFFVGADDAAGELERAGFDVIASLVREPIHASELPARRCYMIAQRRA